MIEDVEFLRSRKGTKIENARALVRLFSDNPDHTLMTLCTDIQANDSFVIQTLGLNRLDPKLVDQVKDNALSIVRAYSLAKLPMVEQIGFHRKHTKGSVLDYCIAVNCRVKEVKDETRSRKSAAR